MVFDSAHVHSSVVTLLKLLFLPEETTNKGTSMLQATIIITFR